MKYYEDYPVNDENIVSKLTGFRDVDEPIDIYVSTVFSRSNDEWMLLAARITDTPQKQINLKYPSYAFFSFEISNISLRKVLSLLSGKGIEIEDGFPFLTKIKNSLSLKLQPTTHNGRDWPERVLEARISESRLYLEEPLIAFNLPFYKSPGSLIKEILEIDEFHGNSDGRLGKLFIELQDKRGRLTFFNNQLNTETAINSCIVGYFVSGDEKVCLHESLNNEKLNWVEKDIKECEIFLITEQNEVLDFLSTSNPQYSNRLVIQNNGNEEEIKRLISKGEGETCEFKKYIDIEKENSKSSDIEKAICAFSNNSGGYLLIGISDDGRVVGVKNEVRRTYQSDITLYVEALKKRAIEKLKYADCCSFEVLTIYGVDILVIEVKPVNSCNMIMANKDVFIRKGATSAKANVDEIAKLVNKEKLVNPFYSTEY